MIIFQWFVYVTYVTDDLVTDKTGDRDWTPMPRRLASNAARSSRRSSQRFAPVSGSLSATGAPCAVRLESRRESPTSAAPLLIPPMGGRRVEGGRGLGTDRNKGFRTWALPISECPVSIAQRLLPALGWLSTYRRDWLLPDVLAGLAVWAVMVPEGMAYAGIVGVPPIMGLYTIVPPLIAYALLGTSRVLVV